MDLHLADAFRKYAAESFGLLGALVGLSFIEKLTVLAAITALVAGGAIAVVGAPILTHYIDPPPAIRDHVLAGSALVLGITGFLIASAIHATALHMRTWLPEFVRRFVERKGGV